MSITANQVKELRDMSGVGMMECKRALVETGGDINKALDLLRANGSLKAEKKASRVAADGGLNPATVVVGRHLPRYDRLAYALPASTACPRAGAVSGLTFHGLLVGLPIALACEFGGASVPRRLLE